MICGVEPGTSGREDERVEMIAGLHPRALDKVDRDADDGFYAAPRFVTHIDAGAIAGVTALYRRVLLPDSVILDLMSSCVSHLPDSVGFREVIGHGMNADELRANARLDRFFVRDLNRESTLPIDNDSLDAVTICVGIQYLQRPLAVFAELRRVLHPGAPVVVTFSDRCFPTQAVAIWQASEPAARVALVSLYFERTGFRDVEVTASTPDDGDPLWSVTGRA